MRRVTGEETKAHKAPEFAHPRCSEFRVQAPRPQATRPAFVFVSTPTGRNRSILRRQVPAWVEVESGWGLELRAQMHLSQGKAGWWQVFGEDPEKIQREEEAPEEQLEGMGKEMVSRGQRDPSQKPG